MEKKITYLARPNTPMLPNVPTILRVDLTGNPQAILTFMPNTDKAFSIEGSMTSIQQLMSNIYDEIEQIVADARGPETKQ